MENDRPQRYTDYILNYITFIQNSQNMNKCQGISSKGIVWNGFSKLYRNKINTCYNSKLYKYISFFKITSKTINFHDVISFLSLLPQNFGSNIP